LKNLLFLFSVAILAVSILQVITAVVVSAGIFKGIVHASSIALTLLEG